MMKQSHLIFKMLLIMLFFLINATLVNDSVKVLAADNSSKDLLGVDLTNSSVGGSSRQPL